MPLTVLRNTGFMKEQHPAKLAGASELHVATRGTTRQCRALYADGLETADIENLELSPRDKLALSYARQLTLRPAEMDASLVDELRSSGFEDGEILEINQVVAYFNYANRTVLGLGASTDGDILGLSPGNSQDPDDWRHG